MFVVGEEWGQKKKREEGGRKRLFFRSSRWRKRLVPSDTKETCELVDKPIKVGVSARWLTSCAKP